MPLRTKPTQQWGKKNKKNSPLSHALLLFPRLSFPLSLFCFPFLSFCFSLSRSRSLSLSLSLASTRPPSRALAAHPGLTACAGRQQILRRAGDGCVFQRLLPFTMHKDSTVRRGGTVGCIRNCCFSSQDHEWLLSDEVAPVSLAPSLSLSPHPVPPPHPISLALSLSPLLIPCANSYVHLPGLPAPGRGRGHAIFCSAPACVHRTVGPC